MSRYAVPSRERFDADDPTRAGTVWTIPGPDGHPLRCLRCGDLVEVLWEHSQAYRLGHAMPLCAEHRADERVLTLLAPPAADVARATAARQATETARAAATSLRRVI